MSAGEDFDEWYCTELQTECAFCEEVIIEPSGNLGKFIDTINRHQMELCAPFQLWMNEAMHAHAGDFGTPLVVNYDDEGLLHD